MQVVGFLMLLLISLSSEATLRVLYPAIDPADPRFDDLLEILEMSLAKTVDTHGVYDLIPSSPQMTESRILQELQHNRRVDVAWSSTSVKKEQNLRPVRIPLRKGILGYRLLLIHKDSQTKFSKVKSLNDFRNYRVGQGIGWGDVVVYKSAGIIVEEAPYQSLFMMINSRRFDAFPRGINEIFSEYQMFGWKNTDMVIEKDIALYYPWPYYFFTSKANEALASRLESGLKEMIRDGSFDRIFLKYNGNAIEQARLHERRLLKLENKLLPSDTPLHQSELWYNPLKAE